MSSRSFALPDSEPPCMVTLPDNLTKEQLLDFVPFQEWLKTFNHSLSLQKRPEHVFNNDPYRLRKIDVQAADWFTKTRLGFIKFDSMITTDSYNRDYEAGTLENGQPGWLPGVVFLRGGTVAMLIVIQQERPGKNSKDTEYDDQKYVVLTVQPRPASGSLALVELPAGMIDGAKGFQGKAADEIREETTLEVSPNELVDMTALAMEKGNVSTHLWRKQAAANTNQIENESAAKPVPKKIKDQRLVAQPADVKRKGQTSAVETAAEKSKRQKCTLQQTAKSNTITLLEGISDHSDEELPTAMFPSPGNCDEYMGILLCEKRLSKAKIDKLRGKLTGLRDEGEVITVKLVRLEDLWKEGARDAKALAALALYEGLKRDGKL